MIQAIPNRLAITSVARPMPFHGAEVIHPPVMYHSAPWKINFNANTTKAINATMIKAGISTRF